MQTSVDRFGRVVIPKSVRRRLGLRPGTLLRIEEAGEEIRLKPVEPGVRVVREGNVAVVAGAQMVDEGPDAVQRDRKERIQKVAGVGASRIITS